MADIVVVGGGGHAKVVISILKKISGFTIIGYTDKENRGEVLHTPYLGDDQALAKIIKDFPKCSAAIGVGNVKITDTRKKIYDKLKEFGFVLPPLISPLAIVNEDVMIHEAAVVIDGAVVNAGSKIGIAAIINTNCSIAHDCDIGDFVHVAPGVAMSGGVKIGANSMIGTGASIIQSITIGENCMIGAGSVVVRDILESGVYFGNPARKHRD